MSSDSEPEDALDIFSRALGMFGDAKECHGEAGGTWKHAYAADSALAGKEVVLRLNRTSGANVALFAHYVWNSAIVISDMLARGKVCDVDGRTVCEMGAGSGLPSITCRLLGARAVVATDYPDDEVIEALKANVEEQDAAAEAGGAGARRCRVAPHIWGQDAGPALSALQSVDGERDSTSFDVIICADTLWMPDQHGNLARSVKALLAPDGLAVVAFTLQHDQTFEFFDAARAEGLSAEEVRVEKLPVLWNGAEVEDLDDHAESKRTVWVYHVRHAGAGAEE